MIFVSILFTMIHVLEELLGEGSPLWDYFGSIVGLRIPKLLGFFLFTIVLSVSLILISVCGYGQQTIFLLSILAGARIGDSIFSHWMLVLIKSPNPGLWSTSLYTVEFILILILYPISFWGFLLGFGFFAAIIPTLKLIRILLTAYRLPQ